MASRILLFLLAVSTLGVSWAFQPRCQATTADIEGPYYIKGAPNRPDGELCNLKQDNPNGTVLIIKGRVTEDDCKTGIHALLDIWQANSTGVYALDAGDYRCRGKMETDPQGYFSVETIVPGRYKDGGSFRPAHVHWKISRINDPNVIFTTQLYFQHDPYNGKNDPCFPTCHSGDPTITMPVHKDFGQTKEDVVWNVVLRRQGTELGPDEQPISFKYSS